MAKSYDGQENKGQERSVKIGGLIGGFIGGVICIIISGRGFVTGFFIGGLIGAVIGAKTCGVKGSVMEMIVFVIHVVIG